MSDWKIFVQKFDFVLGEHDTIGGRSKNFSEKWRQILGIAEILGTDIKFLKISKYSNKGTTLLAKISILY